MEETETRLTYQVRSGEWFYKTCEDGLDPEDIVDEGLRLLGEDENIVNVEIEEVGLVSNKVLRSWYVGGRQ